MGTPPVRKLGALGPACEEPRLPREASEAEVNVRDGRKRKRIC